MSKSGSGNHDSAMSLAPSWATDAEAVSDPSDWIDTSFPFLKDLDASLRCEICADILRAPVFIKTCSHVFCSRCIRDYINQPSAPGAPTERPCPNCRQPKVYDSELVPVAPLELAAEAWRAARALLAQQEAEIRRHAPKSPSPARVLDPATDTPPAARKRRRVNGEQHASASGTGSFSLLPQRVTRSSVSRGSRPSDGSVAADSTKESDDAIVVDDDSDDQDWTPARDDDSGRASSSNVAQIRSGSSAMTREKDLKDITATDVVECPLCQHTFTLQALNRHLDNPAACKGPDGPPPSDRERGLAPGVTSSNSNGLGGWFSRPGQSGNKTQGSKGLSATSQKLKRPQYQLLPEKALRKLCDESGLTTTGSKAVLEARHRRWIDAFNANLDSSPAYRRSEAQLRRDMRDWDREREKEDRAGMSRTGSGRGTASTPHATNGTAALQRTKPVGATVGASEEERRAYAASHATHFRQLVAQSRRTHQLNREVHNGGGDQGASSSDGNQQGGDAANVPTDEARADSPSSTIVATDHEATAATKQGPSATEEESFDVGEGGSIDWSGLSDGEAGGLRVNAEVPSST
ncbi:unnamed protein product [Parajaminaea phylloscopi]